MRRHTLARPALSALACALALLGGSGADAARISEPSTFLYGRIVQRVGEREFPVSSGKLVWTLQTTGPGGRQYQLATALEPLAGGRFSYKLPIPHQLRAYTLSVAPTAVPLGSAGITVQHLSVSLDGQPLSVSPAAVNGFTVNSASRAGSQRIDLVLSGPVVDSDGDGLPDWWEDKNGLDKWDPSDGSSLVGLEPNPPGGNPDPKLPNARNFAEWRAALFPDNTGSLETFADEDPDQDGLPNFVEYAFDLDPTRNDAGSGALPQACVVDGRIGVAFHQRQNATDVAYHVEVSPNLVQWQDGAPQLEPVTLPGNTPNQAAFVPREGSPSPEAQFFRVRVSPK